MDKNTIEFRTTHNELHNTWVMRITADRRIEVAEDVEVTEVAKKVLVAMQLMLDKQQRTWQGLTDEDDLDWEEGGSLKDLVKAIESKLREKNESREWQDLTDDEMLMIYGQKHEGKKYSLGRMVQQALKEKNT